MLRKKSITDLVLKHFPERVLGPKPFFLNFGESQDYSLRAENIAAEFTDLSNEDMFEKLVDDYLFTEVEAHSFIETSRELRGYLGISNKIIIPPTYLEVIDAPLIFLAGPIQGAKRWQDDAIKLIVDKAPELYIASPRRSGHFKTDFGECKYNEQVDWETFHLRKAGYNGVVLFWLAKEFEHYCDRAYAQTTRFELSEWKVRHELNHEKLVLGIENGFTNERYIRRRMMQDCPDVIVYSTLEETCDDAIKQARKVNM